MTKKKMREVLETISEALDEMPPMVLGDVELLIEELDDILEDGWVYPVRG